MLDNKTEFLAKYQIKEQDYRKSKLKWEGLKEIYNDFVSKVAHLNSIGLSISNTLQGQTDVHSVRYRIKDPEHLIGKIIRKVVENPKRKIDLSNYEKEITDLVGVRVIHLFKSNWKSIDQFIRQTWEFKETPIAYFRQGDPEDVTSTFNSSEFDEKVHLAGYRSLHYVIKTKPTKVEHFVELQVRTLFEEGWSEIDHRIRYPNDTSNELINSLLMIFNKLAGSADEIGEYVKALSYALKARDEEYLVTLETREKEILSLRTQIDGLKLKPQQKNKLFESIDQISKSPNPFLSGGNLSTLSEIVKDMSIFKGISNYASEGVDSKFDSINKLISNSITLSSSPSKYELKKPTYLPNLNDLPTNTKED